MAEDTPGTVLFPDALDTIASLIRVTNKITPRLVLDGSLAADMGVVSVDFLGDGTLVPQSGVFAVDNEIFLYTDITLDGTAGGTFTGVVRAADGSTLSTHGTLSPVYFRHVALHHATLSLAIRNIEARLGVGPVLAINLGGTNADNANDARINLGLEIGANIQAWSGKLDDLAALSGDGIVKHTDLGGFSAGAVDLSTDVTGILNDANLSSNVVLENAANVFTNTNQFQAIGVGNTAPNANKLININKTAAFGATTWGQEIILTGTNNAFLFGCNMEIHFLGTGTSAVQQGYLGKVYNDSTGTITDAVGVEGSVFNTGGGAIGIAEGMLGFLMVYGNSTITAGEVVGARARAGDGFGSLGTFTALSLYQGHLLSGDGNIGTLKGLDLSGYGAQTGTITTSYGIYMDTSIDKGATKWALYSLATSPSLLSGELTVLGLLKTGSGPATLTNAAGQLLAAAAATPTGSGNWVLASSPTIVTPTIASFANANHDHSNSAGGGTLNASAIAAGTLASARGGTGSAFFAITGPTALRTYTFPDANAVLARTDAAQTFSGNQTFSGLILVSDSGIARSAASGTGFYFGPEYVVFQAANEPKFFFERGSQNQFVLGSDVKFGWASTASAIASVVDTAFYRNASGVAEVNNGTPGTFRDLIVRTLFINNTTVKIVSGSGSPEGAVTAPVGSLYTRTDGGANTTLYVKQSGTGNTGWAAK